MTTPFPIACLTLAIIAGCAAEPASAPQDPQATASARAGVPVAVAPVPVAPAPATPLPDTPVFFAPPPAAADEPPPTFWQLASRPEWPLTDDYSDPNQIVYDRAYADRWVFREFDGMLRCGFMTCEMAVGKRWVGFEVGSQYAGRVGCRFHLDQLRRFLRSRIAGSTSEFSDAEMRKKFAQVGAPTPYVADICAALKYIGAARACDALPELHALLNNRSESVSYAAARARANIGDPSSLPPLRAMAESEHPALSSAALQAISEIEERSK